MADIKMDFWGNVSIGTMFDIHDNEKVIICTNADHQEEKPKGGQPGPPKKKLFPDKMTANREKERFRHYLSDHKMGNRSLTCQKDDTLNDIVTCFLIKWADLGHVKPEPSGYSVFRFLTEECGLTSGVEEKSYGNEIRERLREKNYTPETWRNVSACFQA